MKRIEFKPPPALSGAVAEGVKPGSKLELMAEFQVKEDGNWCLVAVEGVPMPGYDDEKAAPPPQESQYVKSAMENMPQGYAAA